MFICGQNIQNLFSYIFFLLDAFRTPNFSSEEMLINHVNFIHVYINISATCTSVGLILL